MKRVVVLVAAVGAAVGFAGPLNLVNCPDCGKEVSTRAFMCPKCGCSREAIQAHVNALDAVCRLPASEQGPFLRFFLTSGAHAFQVKEAQAVYAVVTNEVAATARYAPQQKKAAHAAVETIKRMLEMGFTMDQILLLCPDLTQAARGLSDVAGANRR